MLSVISNGTLYSLDDGSICTLVGYSGWGSAPVKRLASQGPMQDGETDFGYRLQRRNASLVVQFPATTLDDMYVRRKQINDLFTPSSVLSLQWVLPYGTRHIDVAAASGFDMAWKVDDWAAARMAIPLRAADPTFYNPEMVVFSFGLSAGGTGWAVPWVIPWTIGSATLDDTRVITYGGNAPSYPIIRIIGPVEDCKIVNEATGHQLFFDGVTIADGDYYEIDCRYGAKTIVDSTGADQQADLSDDSNLEVFRLEVAPTAPLNTNPIHVTGGGVNANTQIYFQYYERFTGI